MSDSEGTPRVGDSHEIARLKEVAKDFLRTARAGEKRALDKLREHLPRLAAADDATIQSSVKLADVQHAIARETGQKSWAALKRLIESSDSTHLRAQRLLKMIRESDPESNSTTTVPEIDFSLAGYSIHTAAALYNSDALSAFLAKDPRLATAAIGDDAWEPIMYLAASRIFRVSTDLAERCVRCATILLDAEASPNTSFPLDHDPKARIPVLYFACAGNNVALARLLLQRGANPNDGESIYHAAERNHVECMQLLLDAGVDVSGPHSDYGNTPLYFLAGYKPFSPLSESSERGMEWLLDHGADPNVRSHSGRDTANAGETPLHRVAAYGKSVAVARMLVDHGADMNAARDDGRTPFVLAVRAGNAAVAGYLTSIGANTTLEPIDELIGACIRADRDRAMGIVRENASIIRDMKKEDKETLALAAEEGRADSVRLMVDLGWDLTAEGAWGGTALHHAAWHGRPGIVALLISLGAPVNFKDSTYGSSAIGWAAHGSVNSGTRHDDDYVNVVNQLIDAGATREAAINHWNESADSLGTKAVQRAMNERWNR